MPKNDDYLRRFFQDNSLFLSHQDENTQNSNDIENDIPERQTDLESKNSFNAEKNAGREINLKKLFDDIHTQRIEDRNKFKKSQSEITQEILYSHSLAYTQYIYRNLFVSFLSGYALLTHKKESIITPEELQKRKERKTELKFLKKLKKYKGFRFSKQEKAQEKQREEIRKNIPIQGFHTNFSTPVLLKKQSEDCDTQNVEIKKEETIVQPIKTIKDEPLRTSKITTPAKQEAVIDTPKNSIGTFSEEPISFEELEKRYALVDKSSVKDSRDIGQKEKFRQSRRERNTSTEYLRDIWETSPEKIPVFEGDIVNPFQVGRAKFETENHKNGLLKNNKVDAKITSYVQTVSKYLHIHFHPEKNKARKKSVINAFEKTTDLLHIVKTEFQNTFDQGNTIAQQQREKNEKKVGKIISQVETYASEYKSLQNKKRIENALQKQKKEREKIERQERINREKKTAEHEKIKLQKEIEKQKQRQIKQEQLKQEQLKREENLRVEKEKDLIKQKAVEAEEKKKKLEKQKVQIAKDKEIKAEIERKKKEEEKKNEILRKEALQKEYTPKEKKKTDVLKSSKSQPKVKVATPFFISATKSPSSSFPRSFKKEFSEWGKILGGVVGVFLVGAFALGIPSGYMQQYESVLNADLFAEKQESIANLIEDKQNPFADMQTLPVAGEEKEEISFIQSEFLNIAPPDTRIVIPKIAKNIPIIQTGKESRLSEDWEKLEAEIQDALQDGVVHYPGTAMPGEDGNVFITGHSSYYPWDPGNYKDVFAPLHNLEVGDVYYIFHKGKKYEYEITERKVVPPSDVSVLDQDHTKKESTLMTCTPIGTAKNRLILKAKEISVGY